MKPSEVSYALEVCVRANRPALVHGNPGIGKTSLFRQLAKKLGREFRFFSAISKDPVDITGLPMISDGRTKWSLPDLLPTEGEGIFLIDDIGQAPPLVQASLWGIVRDEAENWQKPPGWWIGAASNLDTDRALVQRMPTPLKSSLIHFLMTIDLDDFARYALTETNIRMEIVRFLQFRPQLLHNFEEAKNDRTFCCPRTWEYVSQLIDAGIPAALELEMIKGTVGEAAAIEFVAFLRIWRELPSVDGILLAPKGAAVPEDPATLYALTGALAMKATKDNMPMVAQYCDRLSPEFSVLCITSAIRRDPKLQATRAFGVWAAEHSDIVS